MCAIPVPPVACVPLRLVSYYPKEIEAYRGNRSEPVSGRQWSVSIRPDVGNRSEGASGRPPVSGRPMSVFSCVPVLPMMSPPMMMHTHTGASLSVFSCVPVLPMMSPPMMMHTHTGASLSVIACVCYSCPSCPPVFLWGVGIITRKRLKHTGARERACRYSPVFLSFR